MEILYYPDKAAVCKALEEDAPLLVLVSFDGQRVIIGDIDEYMEHHILLEAAGYDSRDTDKFFRFVADSEGADRTFVCPPDYRGIKNKMSRIERFYKDGLEAGESTLSQAGLGSTVNISKRYRRHLDFMNG